MNKFAMTIHELWILLAIGLAAGVLSGMVGIGGGIVMVPALVLFIGYTQHQAQGTSLAVLTLPVVVLGAWNYYKACEKMGTPIDIRVAGVLAITFIFGAYLGSKWAVKIDKDMLKKIFAVVLFYTAFKMLNWDTQLVKWVKGFF
jgi:uncharacterized membrane protein YfcA